jgi:hypothetical protein
MPGQRTKRVLVTGHHSTLPGGRLSAATQSPLARHVSPMGDGPQIGRDARISAARLSRFVLRTQRR